MKHFPPNAPLCFRITARNTRRGATYTVTDRRSGNTMRLHGRVARLFLADLDAARETRTA